MPRLGTDVTGVTWSLPTVSWFVGSWYCRRDDVQQRISVLVAFSCNLLELIQSATAEKHSDIRFSTQLVAPGWQNPYIWVSSVYKCGCRSYDWITITKSAVYNRNRRGPRTDPCGTPKSTIAGVDLLSLQRTNWVRWSKYDTNHWSTTPSRPYEISNRRSRILWSTADKSIRANISRSPLSTAVRMSESTFNTAVCVPWCARYADCRSGNSLNSSTCNSSCLATKRSKTLARTGRLEISL